MGEPRGYPVEVPPDALDAVARMLAGLVETSSDDVPGSSV